MIRLHLGAMAMAASLASASAAPGQQPAAAPTPPGDRWTIEVAPYLWIAAMDGHANVGGIKADVDVPFQ